MAIEEQLPTGPLSDTRVEVLTAPTRPGKPWVCRLEDGSHLQVSQREIADFALYAGRKLSAQEIEDLRSAAVRSYLHDKSLSLLTGRPHSAGELVEKLKRQGAEEEDAWEAAQWAENLGLLNDEEYAKTLVRHYSAKGYGLYHIKNELYRHKVPRACWEDALDCLPDPEEAVDRFLEKHLRSDEPKEIKRVSDALSRRGFSWGDITHGLRRWRLVDEEDFD